jgi:hypothetical protein
MSDLASFQRQFAEALMMEGQPDSSFRSQAFAVYRNTAARGTVEALRATYQTVDMLVGEEMFTQVALDYRQANPPAGPVLSDYGRDFAAFLSRQPWTCELPYLADVACLDWLWLESFIAADEIAAPAAAQDSSRIALHPATRFAWLSTPAMSIWLAHRDPWEMAELEPDWVEEGALFTRLGQYVRAELVDTDFYRLLLACSTPTSVGALMASVAATFPHTNVRELLQRGIVTGALVIQ